MTKTMDDLCVNTVRTLAMDAVQRGNHITIEGNTALAYSDDVATRFIGYGWNVTRVGDANDLAMVERAFKTFKHTTDRPTLVIVDSHIAYGRTKSSRPRGSGPGW